MRSCVITCMFLVAGPLWAQAVPQTDTAEAALAAFKLAVSKGDLKAAAGLTAGEAGEALRRLAEPLAQAKAASDRLDKAAADRKLDFANPFAAALTPFADVQFD